jgi:hypothetical protein
VEREQAGAAYERVLREGEAWRRYRCGIPSLYRSPVREVTVEDLDLSA